MDHNVPALNSGQSLQEGGQRSKEGGDEEGKPRQRETGECGKLCRERGTGGKKEEVKGRER